MEGLSRGDIVAVALQGDLGKPRPAIIIQDDAFQLLNSLTVIPLTTAISQSPLLRVPIAPTPGNGLRAPSEAMVDKISTLPTPKVGPRIGTLDQSTLALLDAALVRFLGLARF
jgi:mRNA interferase MazF